MARNQLPVFVSKVLLEVSPIHLCIVPGYLCSVKALLSSCNRDYIACKVLNIYYLAFKKKKVGDPCSNHTDQEKIQIPNRNERYQ